MQKMQVQFLGQEDPLLCCPLLLLPPIPPSIRVFSNESTLPMRWPNYLSFSFSIIPYKEHPGLIFFRMDWLDLLVVQGTLKSLLQHHSSKASILWRSAFFTVQLSHPFITTGKIVAQKLRNLCQKCEPMHITLSQQKSQNCLLIYSEAMIPIWKNQTYSSSKIFQNTHTHNESGSFLSKMEPSRGQINLP